ncbi:MAG: PQQ-binding-like beta-propeller repeat protein [Verrucomicrobia bacterium]|nr:PQQ-binding-like beta-propeller repeat protein [Verrucomicrobiota bacterium]
MPVALALLLSLTARAEDWPQFRGSNRDSVWNETGILQTFPAEGLKVRWRAPIGAGFSSPVVAKGRVYVTDSRLEKPKSWERVHCFDERSGKPLWISSNEVHYVERAFEQQKQGSPSGPCPTPIVEGGRLFTLGATGDLLCLDARTGRLIWKKILTQTYRLEESPEMTSCPLIEGGLLVVLICGKPSACVVAFDKRTGKEVWRALNDPPHAFSSPIVISAGGKRQLIVWTPKAVTSLNPATGKTWWREELITREDYAVATPVHRGEMLLVSGLMFRLGRNKPAASVLWPETKALSLRVLSHTCMPLILGEHVFAGKMGGRLVCLEARTGKQVWETDKVTGLANAATIHLTPNGDSVLIFTDQGNLIRARLDAAGYYEQSRVQLIEPDYQFGDRKIVFAPLAFANRHVFARNCHELICASLATKP